MTARELAAPILRKHKWSPFVVDEFLEGRRELPAILELAQEIRKLRDQLGYYHP